MTHATGCARRLFAGAKKSQPKDALGDKCLVVGLRLQERMGGPFYGVKPNVNMGWASPVVAALRGRKRGTGYSCKSLPGSSCGVFSPSSDKLSSNILHVALGPSSDD